MIEYSEAWKYCPDTFAFKASQGEWLPYNHVVEAFKIIHAELLKGGARIIINMPPRHGKSLSFTKWLPLWFLSMWPQKKVIIASYEHGVATDWSSAQRDEIQTNELIPLELDGRYTAGDNWKTTAGGGCVAAGVGSAITGRGMHLGIIDDPVKDWKQAHSVTYQKDCVNWYKSTFNTRLEPGANVIVIMTRWTDKDLTGHLLTDPESNDRWIQIKLPALAEEGDPLGRKEGEALCPERFTRADLLLKKKEVGSMVFAGLYQQRPSPASGGIFKRDWWKYYKVLPSISNFDDSLTSWDMNFKETTTGSFVVGSTIGRIDADFIFMPYLFRDRVDYPVARRAVINSNIKYPWVRAHLVEDKANGSAILADLNLVIPGMIAWQPQGKLVQAQAASPLLESGNVLLPDPQHFPEASWVPDWVEEFAAFPKGGFDDQVDSGCQGLLKLKERMNEGGIYAGRA